MNPVSCATTVTVGARVTVQTSTETITATVTSIHACRREPFVWTRMDDGTRVSLPVRLVRTVSQPF